MADLHRRLTLNSLSNVLRYLFGFAVAFLLTPFVVRTLGDGLYGFWVVLLSFAGYAGILELGVQPAVVRLVGQHSGRSEDPRLRELLDAAFAFFAGVGLLAAFVLALGLPFLLGHFARDLPSSVVDPKLALLIGFDVAVMFLNTFLAGILYGRQRYQIKNAVDVASWIMNAGLVFLFLERGGILVLALAKTVTDLLALAATALLVRRIFPDLRWRYRVHTKALRELLGFGGRLFVSATSTRIATYGQPLVLSSRISSSATAFFAIPVRLVDYSREIVWALTTGFMPTFSELAARGERDILRNVYFRYSRYVILLYLPVIVLIWSYGPAFIAWWIGPEYGERGRLALYLLAGAAFVENLQPLVWRLMIGMGKLDFMVGVSATASLLSLVLAFFLTPHLGIPGAGLALLLCNIVAQVAYLNHVSRYLEMPARMQFVQVHARPLAAGALLLAVAWGVVRTLGHRGLLEVSLGVALILLAHVALVGWIGLRADERRWLRARWPRARAGARASAP